MRLPGALGLIVSLSACNAQAAELIAGVGQARYGQCGENGCWRQPPLPYSFDLVTTAWSAGLRAWGFELVYEDHGSVSVSGTYVDDTDYDPKTSTVRAGAKTYTATVRQRQHGWRLSWQPRWQTPEFYIQPSLGALYYVQRETFDVSLPWSGVTITERGHVTPAWGLELGVRTPAGRIGLQYSGYLRTRYTNSIAGGGRDHRIGMQSVGVTFRIDVP